MWGNVLYFGAIKFMPDKLREVLFLFLIEWRKHLRLCELRIRRFFIGLGILNCWVLSLCLTFGINFGVRTYFVPLNQICLNVCGLRSDRISLERICGYIPFLLKLCISMVKLIKLSILSYVLWSEFCVGGYFTACSLLCHHWSSFCTKEED